MKTFKTLFQRGIMIFLLLIVSSLYAKNIYVAKNGNDNNPGTQSQPYKTIAKASSAAQPGDTIIIGEGTYEEMVRPARSGQAGLPITYTSKDGEKVIISAMQALSGWQRDNGAIYKVKVDWDLGQENFVMNGNTAMDLARWPNNVDGDLFTLNSRRNDGGSGSNVVNGAFLTSSQIPNINWSGGAVFFFGDKPGSGWIAWKEFITSSSPGRVDFKLDKNPNWIRTFHAPADKGDFYLEGVKGALDYQNEWWFNSQTKELFVQIPGGSAPANGTISMRRRTVSIDLSGRSYIHIRNLAVFGGAINMPGNTSHNLIYGVSSFYGNHILGVQKGFSANRQSVLLEGNNNTVERCEIAFGAANGIKVSGDNNKIINSRIHDFNYIGSYDAPINARGGRNTLFKGNTIFRGGRDGVQFFNRNSEFAYNDVYQSNLINDDCALLYTVGGPHYGEIHHNWFHDNQGRGRLNKAAGIYLDNDAEAFSVHHNVIWNTEWTGVQINWDGKDIDVFNNTFLNNSDEMGAWHKEGTSFTNVKVWNNLGFKGEWEPQSNKQNNMVVGVNTFVGAGNGDFRLKSGTSPINSGRVINGITDGYVGNAPDIGAYEFGGEDWVAGINWNPDLGPTGNGCYGLPGEECTDTSGPDTVAFVNPVTIIQSQTSYDFEIAYDASTNREVVVEFWSSIGWLGQQMAVVNPGSGTVNITIDLPSAPVAGTGYIYKAHIRPVGSTWQEAIDRDQVDNVTVQDEVFGDQVNFNNPPLTVAPASSYSFDINYEASTNREIVVEFWSSTSWLGQNNVQVARGSGNITVTVDLATPPSPGTGYVYKLHIRPIGSSWQDAIDRDQVNNVTVSSSNELPNISFTGVNDGANFATGVSIKPTVIATDADGTISNVKLYLNNQFIRQENIAPYEWGHLANNDPQLKNLSNGSYVLKAIATDNDGGESSLSISFTVSNPNQQLIANGTYFIASTQSDQRLLSRGLENHSARMINPLEFNDQSWGFNHIGDNVYTIRNLGTNRFLEVPYARCSNGENVATWTDANEDHKKWEIIENGNGIYGLKPLHCTAKALDRAAGTIDANVQIWDYSSNNNNQKWKIIPSGARQNPDLDIQTKLSVHPNPSKDNITIVGAEANDLIIIYDLAGKKIKETKLATNNEPVLISDIAPGVYILSVFGKDKVQFIKE